MTLVLDLFFEGEESSVFARGAAADLQTMVGQLAPHVQLQIDVRQATAVMPWEFCWEGYCIHAVMHEPTQPGRQSVLIADRDIGPAAGWGGRGYAVVSKMRMEEKAGRGGDPVDILMHEWLHTLEGLVINGRPVPFVDLAREFGYSPEAGPDGDDRWPAWYRFVLGG